MKTMMSQDEQLVLFALVKNLRPKRVLEIGYHSGGSAHLILTALDGSGSLVSIDPDPKEFPDELLQWENFRLVVGSSPEDIPDEPIDLAWIDGNHNAARPDLDGVWRHLVPGGHVLLHDINYPPVKEAISSFLADNPEASYVQVSKWKHTDEDGQTWGGLGLIQRN